MKLKNSGSIHVRSPSESTHGAAGVWFGTGRGGRLCATPPARRRVRRGVWFETGRGGRLCATPLLAGPVARLAEVHAQAQKHLAVALMDVRCGLSTQRERPPGDRSSPLRGDAS